MARRRKKVKEPERPGVSYKYALNQEVLCYYKNMLYEAKCIKQRMLKDEANFLVHYIGWKTRWNEWVTEDLLLPVNDVNLDLMKRLNENEKERVKKIKTLKRGKKRKFSNAFSNKCTEEPTPSTSNSNSVVKRKRGRPQKVLNIPIDGLQRKTLTSRKTNKLSYILNVSEYNQELSVSLERLSETTIQKYTGKKTHTTVTEKYSIETNTAKINENTSAITNPSDTNEINTINVRERISTSIGFSEVSPSSSKVEETSNNLICKCVTCGIDSNIVPQWVHTIEKSYQVSNGYFSSVTNHCPECKWTCLERVKVFGKIVANSYNCINANDIGSDSIKNMMELDFAPNKCIESAPLATESKNVSEVGIFEHFEAIKGNLSATEIQKIKNQVDELFENSFKDIAQKNNTEQIKCTTETISISEVSTDENSLKNSTDIIQVNELSDSSFEGTELENIPGTQNNSEDDTSSKSFTSDIQTIQINELSESSKEVVQDKNNEIEDITIENQNNSDVIELNISEIETNEFSECYSEDFDQDNYRELEELMTNIKSVDQEIDEKNTSGLPLIEMPEILRKEMSFDWVMNTKYKKTLHCFEKFNIADVLHDYTEFQTNVHYKLRAKNFAIFLLRYFNSNVNNLFLYQNEYEDKLKKKLQTEFRMTFSDRTKSYPYFYFMNPRKIWCYTYGPLYLLRLLAVLKELRFTMSKEECSYMAYFIKDLLKFLEIHHEKYFPVQEQYIVERNRYDL